MHCTKLMYSSNKYGDVHMTIGTFVYYSPDEGISGAKKFIKDDFSDIVFTSDGKAIIGFEVNKYWNRLE